MSTFAYVNMSVTSRDTVGLENGTDVGKSHKESLAQYENVGFPLPNIQNEGVMSKEATVDRGVGKKELSRKRSGRRGCGCGCVDLRASGRLEFAVLGARGRVVDRGCQSQTICSATST